MFAATITLTIDGDAKVLNRVNQDNFGSEYRLNGDTEGISLKIRHSTDSVDSDGIVMLRHNVFIERVTYATPTVAMKKATYTFTMRHGRYEAPVDTANLAIAANAWLAASTNQAIKDLAVGIN